MRDHQNGRRGFEAVLMAVAASFVGAAVTTTSVLAQTPQVFQLGLLRDAFARSSWGVLESQSSV